jgi:peptide deformylase
MVVTAWVFSGRPRCREAQENEGPPEFAETGFGGKVSKLVYWPAGILKQASVPLTQAPDGGLIVVMKAIMRQYNGAGLSAVQIGELQRLFVVDSGALGPSVFVNPVITEFVGDRVKMREGCLSVPGFFEEIYRAPIVKVTYRDEKFELHENVEFHGYMAHVIQHESEHLDGKLYLDHLPAATRSAIMGNMQKLRKAGKLR